MKVLSILPRPEQTTSLIIVLAVIIIKYTQGFHYQLLLLIPKLHSPGHTSTLSSGLMSPSAYSSISPVSKY